MDLWNNSVGASVGQFFRNQTGGHHVVPLNNVIPGLREKLIEKYDKGELMIVDPSTQMLKRSDGHKYYNE
jgi:hypothetical protein